MTTPFRIQPVSQSTLTHVDFSSLRFGEVFSDHMAEVIYENKAWQQGEIRPFGPIEVSPALSVLHYGQAVFEGLKAFRYSDGRINIFRADRHYERFLASCERMSIPELPRDAWFEALDTLLTMDAGFVPNDTFKSYYIRPFVIAAEPYLGVRPSTRYRFMVIGGPVGNYYSEGIKPVKLTTMPEYARAMKGGTGNAKSPGNYAATLKPSFLAMEQGYAQVLWLDAKDRTLVEEVGTSNIFFVIDGVLVTPALTDSILRGVTRDTVITLAKEFGISVEERTVSIDEVIDAGRTGRLSEVFASGTAAVISPVGLIHHNGATVELDQAKMGPVAQRFYDTITGIHHGTVADTHGWTRLLGDAR
jgi:branched-chain amino acid aminotransferase